MSATTSTSTAAAAAAAAATTTTTTTTTTTSDVDAADAPATVFTVALDRYVDDYKRPEGTTEILGAFATKHAAGNGGDGGVC